MEYTIASSNHCEDYGFGCGYDSPLSLCPWVDTDHTGHVVWSRNKLKFYKISKTVCYHSTSWAILTDRSDQRTEIVIVTLHNPLMISETIF